MTTCAILVGAAVAKFGIGICLAAQSYIQCLCSPATAFEHQHDILRFTSERCSLIIGDNLAQAGTFARIQGCVFTTRCSSSRA